MEKLKWPVKHDRDLLVYIGRFSPCHLGHIHTVKHALQTAKHILILVGSADEARSMRNPWTYSERVSMMRAALGDELYDDDIDRVSFMPLHDWTYQDNKWKKQVHQIVAHFMLQYNEGCLPHEKLEKVNIVGCDKDDTTYYINEFPQWGHPVLLNKLGDIDATTVRDRLFNHGEMHPQLPISVICWLTDNFSDSKPYYEVVEEYKFQQKHDEMWKHSPYPVIFTTVDSVVIQSGHILLVQRKNCPGKNLWALPGGYLNHDEDLKEAAIRELREETRLKVPVKVLRGSNSQMSHYASIHRSSRGRIITFAYLFELEDGKGLPEIRGSSDAKVAKWVPLKEFEEMRSQMFEDHYHIVHHMLGI